MPFFLFHQPIFVAYWMNKEADSYLSSDASCVVKVHRSSCLKESFLTFQMQKSYLYQIGQ